MMRRRGYASELTLSCACRQDLQLPCTPRLCLERLGLRCLQYSTHKRRRVPCRSLPLVLVLIPGLLPVQSRTPGLALVLVAEVERQCLLSEVEPQLQATKTVTLTTRTARHSTCTTAPPWSAWHGAVRSRRSDTVHTAPVEHATFVRPTVHHLIRWEEVLHQSRSMHSTSMQWTIRTGSPTASCSVALTRMGLHYPHSACSWAPVTLSALVQ